MRNQRAGHTGVAMLADCWPTHPLRREVPLEAGKGATRR